MATTTDIDRWGFISGMVAAREDKLLTGGLFEQLAGERDAEAIVNRLRETAVGEVLRQADDLKRAESDIAGFFEEAIAELRKYSPSYHLINLFELPLEFSRLKNYIKKSEMQMEVGPTAGKRHPEETWRRLWEGLHVEVTPCYEKAVDQARLSMEKFGREPEVVDVAVDNICLAAQLDEARKTGSDFILDYMRRYDCVKGVELLWRARMNDFSEDMQRSIYADRHNKELFMELLDAPISEWADIIETCFTEFPHEPLSGDGEVERLRKFVNAADEWLMQFAREARYFVSGPERVFGYLVALKAEMDNIKLLVIGRAQALDPELLKARLKPSYIQ